MKKNIKILKILVFYISLIVIIISPINLLSQGGSNYSIFGIGDIELSSSSAYEGLAGTCLAIPMEHAINPLNPALWSKVTKTRLIAGYKFNQHLTEDVKDNFLYQNNGHISGISAIFAIDTSTGISVALGLSPYSTVNYLISVPLEVSNEGTLVTGKALYQGSGGISTAYFGGSVNILDNLSFGISALANFGVINTNVTTSFNDQNYFTVSTYSINRFKGYGFRTGILYEPISGLNLGLFTELHQKIDLEKEDGYGFAFDYDSSVVNTSSISLPNAFGAGISYLTGKFRFAADYKLYNFKDLDFNKGPNTEFRNLQVFSLGISRLGNQSMGANYLDKVTYNLGLGYTQLYYNIGGKDIDELYGSAGMNFPIVGTSMIDASFTFGSKGIKTDKLIHEYFGRFSLDISIGETWFKPFKREY